MIRFSSRSLPARIFCRWRLLLLGGFCLLPQLLRAQSADFNLPAGTAATALLEFSRQAKVEVLFSFDELAQVHSAAVVGRFQPQEALALLLRDTGFIARRNGRGKFTVTRDQNPTGSIVGRLLTPEGTPAAGIQITIPAIGAGTLSNETGDFSFPRVAPGTYRVVVGASSFRTLEITDARVEANRRLRLETQTLQRASDPTQLEPYVVHDQSGRDEAFDRSNTPLIPQTATGNLDLSRTENDAVPYTIFDRKQIVRSGVVNLNEFLQREVLEGNASARAPDENAAVESYVAGSTNLNLRGYESDETVVLVNGRRLPEVITSAYGNSGLPPDVSLIPISLVEQIEVLPVSASALYSGNPVGGVINIVLRPTTDVTELSVTYTNTLARYDAPQVSLSLQNGQSLLGGALRVRLSATYTLSEPATESELGFITAHDNRNVPLTAPVFRATPNIRSLDQSPLFATGTASVTSVAPGANGSGGGAAFAGREGVRNFTFFSVPGGLVASTNSSDYPYGREQRRSSYFLSVAADVNPALQLGVDATYAHTVVHRGFDELRADLTVAASSPYNPFPEHDIAVSLNETSPVLGREYSEARFDFFSLVAGALVKLPADWVVAADSQFARNITKYRGVGGADPARWQSLVDAGIYNPFRDTQVFGPPKEFYDQVLTYRGGRGKFVTVGDYDTLDAALRVSNHTLMLPSGTSVVNVGTDYRRIHLDDYTDERRYADGTLASAPYQTKGRVLQRVSVFGEIQAPLVPATWLPSWLRTIETDMAVRYIVADTSRETNIAPTVGLKAELAHGVTLRGTFTTSNRVPTPQLSLPVAQPGGVPGVNYTRVDDPIRGEKADVLAADAPSPNLRPESAVSQNAGIIFKHGKQHRFRASLDFVDTRKTNEVKVLGAQDVVNLESVFPDRVIRASKPNGAITAVTTGAVNVASRHSQNWNLAFDYAEAKFLGGTFEAYTRLVYFAKYRVRINPNSPAVDEVDHPDVPTFALLKYRANFGASWANEDFGFGIDGHYFHARALPPTQVVVQGKSRISAYLPYDLYLQSNVTRWLPWHDSRYGLRGQIRVNNIFDTAFPRYSSSDVGVQPYGDWRGRTYSLSLTATF